MQGVQVELGVKTEIGKSRPPRVMPNGNCTTIVVPALPAGSRPGDLQADRRRRKPKKPMNAAVSRTWRDSAGFWTIQAWNIQPAARAHARKMEIDLVGAAQQQSRRRQHVPAQRFPAQQRGDRETPHHQGRGQDPQRIIEDDGMLRSGCQQTIASASSAALTHALNRRASMKVRPRPPTTISAAAPRGQPEDSAAAGGLRGVVEQECRALRGRQREIGVGVLALGQPRIHIDKEAVQS